MDQTKMLPLDTHNQRLLENVHPANWQNPEPTGRYNLVILGGGTAGLITAAVASSMGARTALIEKSLLGGDCLNVGCVPSKAVIHGARGAAGIDALQREELAEGQGLNVRFPAVMERLRRIRGEISGHDSAARYRDEFGVDVYIGHGEFSGRQSVTVTGDHGDTRELSFSRAVIATGARAAAPPIPGLEDTPYLTNESLFSLTERPESLVIVGAGPIGCEMAQSFARLGSRVDLVEMAPRVLPREDSDVAAVVQEALVRDGVALHLGAGVSGVRGDETQVEVQFSDADGATQSVTGTHLLIAIGRAPNTAGLNLEAAGVAYHPRGITVDDHLRTSNSRIYAAGDIASPYQFTHMAEAAAAIVVQNALFFPTARMSALTVPWSTYTSPEVAHVGLSEDQARKEGVAVDVYRHEMGAVDRARLEGETEGFVKILTARGKTRILGATIVAAHAGETMAEIVLAMQNKLGIDKLAGVIHPYPTQAEAVKRAAAGYLRGRLTPRTKAILNRWFAWRR